MEIDGKMVQMQVDSGASCNVRPKRNLSEGAEVQKTDKYLTTYNKEKMSAAGTARVSMRNPKTRTKYNAEFVLVDGNYMPILGARAAQQMGLLVVQHDNILQLHNNEAPTLPRNAMLTKEQTANSLCRHFPRV